MRSRLKACGYLNSVRPALAPPHRFTRRSDLRLLPRSPPTDSQPVSSSRTRTALVALELFVAATAIGGGVALVAGLEGDRFPLGWLTGTPFADYIVLGLILAAVVGGSAAGATIALVRRSAIGLRSSLVAGLLLAGWTVGEVVLIRADNELVSPMEALYLVVGLATIGSPCALGGPSWVCIPNSVSQPAQTVDPARRMSDRRAAVLLHRV